MDGHTTTTHPNAVVYVDIYEGSTLIAGNIAADQFRQDLVDAGKGNGYTWLLYSCSFSTEKWRESQFNIEGNQLQ